MALTLRKGAPNKNAAQTCKIWTAIKEFEKGIRNFAGELQGMSYHFGFGPVFLLFGLGSHSDNQPLRVLAVNACPPPFSSISFCSVISTIDISGLASQRAIAIP
jgi:hypothetical protein